MTMKLRSVCFLLMFSLLGDIALARVHTAGGSGDDAQQNVRVVEEVSQPTGWKRYEIQYGEGNAVRVIFPAAPQITDQDIPFGNSHATNHMVAAYDDKGAYLVGYMEGLPVPLSNQPEAQTQFFTGFWQGLAEGMREELKKKGIAAEVTQQPQREATISGRRAQWQDFAVGEFAGSAKAVVSDGQAYMIVTISYEKSLGENSTAFLNSFYIRARQ